MHLEAVEEEAGVAVEATASATSSVSIGAFGSTTCGCGGREGEVPKKKKGTLQIPGHGPGVFHLVTTSLRIHVLHDNVDIDIDTRWLGVLVGKVVVRPFCPISGACL